MSKVPFLILLALLAVAPAAAQSNAAHTARTSLDWSGTYTGTIPCADCEGIGTELTLLANGSYRMLTVYRGRTTLPETEYGWVHWGAEGNTIVLAASGDDGMRFHVGESTLTMLDRDGKPITGALAKHYLLRKGPIPLGGTRWRLTALRGKDAGPNAPFLIIDTAAQRVSGSAGCNRFTGTFTPRANGRIAFGPLAVTQMACAEMGTERQFLEVMGMADGYLLRGERLQLIKARMAPLAEFVAEQDTSGPVTAALLRPFAGAWEGTLTYRDYSSGKPVNIPVAMEVSVLGTDAFRRAVSYPKEPHMNGTDTIRFGGWSIDDEMVQSVRRAMDSTVTVVSELQGTDGNDHRPATFRITYQLNDSQYVKRKEVRFTGTTEWITRHEYRYTRCP